MSEVPLILLKGEGESADCHSGFYRQPLKTSTEQYTENHQVRAVDTAHFVSFGFLFK